MKRSFSKICLLGAVIPLILVTHAVGAVIIWGTPTTTDINSPSQVLNNGTTQSVYDGINVAVTLNGVSWTNAAVPTNTIGFGGGGSYTGGAALGPGITTPYSTLVDAIAYVSNAQAPTKPIVFSNLTPGNAYEIQLWAGYFFFGTTVRYSSSAPDGLADSHAANESAALTVSNSVPGQFIVGTWTADAITQNLYYFGSGGYGELSALQVRDLGPVPEPQTWALAGLGLTVVIFRLRRKQRAAVSLG